MFTAVKFFSSDQNSPYSCIQKFFCGEEGGREGGGIMSCSNEKYGSCRRDNAKYWTPIFVLSALPLCLSISPIFTCQQMVKNMFFNRISFHLSYIFPKHSVVFVVRYWTKPIWYIYHNGVILALPLKENELSSNNFLLQCVP